MKKTFLKLLFFIAITTSYASNNKYRLIITDNPATTIMIGWNQTSGTNPTVYYGTADFGTNWSNYTNSKTVDRSVNFKAMNNKFAKLTGLTPNTNYYFVIKDSEGTSARYWFKTAPSTNERMSFIAGGDSRNNRTARNNANSLVSKLKPTAVFFGGDMTNRDTSAEWQVWFDDWQNTIASDGRMFPILPTRGNHERANTSIYNLFNVSSSNVYYEITFGNDLYTIYTLNSEMSAGGNQSTWLSQRLSSNTSIWKSAQYHKPMRPHASFKSEGNDEYNNWAQLFYDNGVDLVYESDSHVVKTTWPIKPCSGGSGCDQGFVRDDANGTVYVGEGCWGAPLRTADDSKAWTRNDEVFNQFKWIFVSESEIEVRTIKVNNAVNVAALTNTNPFAIPANLDIWNPSNGSVITLLNTNTGANPEVTITNPLLNSTHAVNTNLLIEANASDSDGTVTEVKFYAGTNLIGTDTTVPYSINWTPTVNNQQYNLKAVVTDNQGNEVISEQVTIFVGSVETTISSTINSGNDDVEERQNTGVMYRNSSDLELAYDNQNSGNQHVGMLFRNLNIPKDATITNAYIQFTTDEAKSGNTSLNIKVQNSVNAPDITSQAYNISSRNYYTSSVSWNPVAWNTVGQSGMSQRTPELKALVQYIVNKANWSSGNKMLFYISGTGKRTAESYEGSSTQAPKLVITYKVENSDGGGGIPTCEDVSINIVFDRYSSETSWTLKDSSGQTVMSGSGYRKNNGDTITVSECLPPGCYDFKITDTYGDGICCKEGNGSYTITDNQNNILTSGGAFNFSETKQICIGTSARTSILKIKEKSTSSNLLLYPNPVSDKLFIRSKETTILWTARIFNLLGKEILEVPVLNNSIDTSVLTKNSIYFVEIYDEFRNKKISKKILTK